MKLLDLAAIRARACSISTTAGTFAGDVPALLAYVHDLEQELAENDRLRDALAERALTAEERLEQMTHERDEARAQLAAIGAGSPCDGHRHCCADRRKLAEELLRVRAERDEARKILEETIEYCENYIWELAQTKEELIMLQEHERSRNHGRTLDQLSDELSWEDAYRRGLLEGSKAVALELAKLDEVRALLDANGGDCNCDCDCDHADENHEPDCVRCLSWRISLAIEKT